MLKAARLVGLKFGRSIFEFGTPGSTGSNSGSGQTGILRLGRYYRSHDGDPEFDARVTGLLVDPAAAALEELRIAAGAHCRNTTLANLHQREKG